MLKELISDDSGKPTGARLQLLGGWVVSSLIVLWYAYPRELSKEFLYAYLAYCAGVYGYAIRNNIQKIKATK